MLAERGCLLERCLTTPHSGKTTWEHVFDGVRAVGIERTLFSSDWGTPTTPRSRTGSRSGPIGCSRRAFDEDEVQEMIVGQSRRLVEGGVSRKLLVIGAHSADFVWRAGGVIAVTTSGGGAVLVLALSYGERGESGELWQEPEQTVERVKEIRHGEAERAAAALGADFECLDLGDYPLEVDRDALAAIADRIREFAPDVLVTHTDRDPFNPDHAIAFFAVERARALAAGAGVASAFETFSRRSCCCSSRTSRSSATSFRRRSSTSRRSSSRSGCDGGDEGAGIPPDVLRQRAEQRGNHARRSSGNTRSGMRRHSSASHRRLWTRCDRIYAELAELGTATVHEAAGRSPVVDVPLIQVVPGRGLPVRRAPCVAAQNDNLMVHAADRRGARRARCSC